MYMECLKCNELMGEYEDPKNIYETIFKCPKCKCKVAPSDGSGFDDEDDDD